MKTLGDRLDEYKGLGPGFDFLRIGLACSIVMTHAALLSDREWINNTPLWYVNYALVPMFFALSGFLITGSALRLSLKNFLINRGLRIVPALSVEVFVAALIIGPIMTTYPIVDYFTDYRFWGYFRNMIGWIHYELPGVFENNFSNRVNGALWTVPWEIGCYLVMSALIITKIIKKPNVTLLVTVAYLLCGLAVHTLSSKHLLPQFLDAKLLKLFVSRGSQLISSFLMGILLFQFRARIPYSLPAIAFCAAIAIAGIFVLDLSSIESIGNRFVVLPALVYVTIWIGLTPVPLPKALHRGDYSYGIYLYHDPLLQTLIATLPLSIITGRFGWLVLVGLGLPAAFLVATLSWHFIEKPVLGLRKKFSFVAQVRGVTEGTTRQAPPSAPQLSPDTRVAEQN